MLQLKQLYRDEQRASLLLLGLLLLVLCVGGGASRASELGQVVVRFWAILSIIILCMMRKTWTVREVRLPLLTVAAIAFIAIVQLIPLPPAVWMSLPGRAPFEAAISSGEQPWRPINLTPDRGFNSLLSLSVPTAVLVILAGIPRSRPAMVVNLLMATTILTAFVGSLQLSGATFNNPFINETIGEAAGVFANRNHQALFLASALPLIASWACSREEARAFRARWLVAAGLMIWYLLLILATGSRAGMVLSALGLVAAGVLAWPAVLRAHTWSRRSLALVIALAVSILAAIVLLGVASDRALSLSRLVETSDGEMRTRSLPLLSNLITNYFPVGSGLGSFDPVFRIIEPRELLNPNYFNHAHNDALELVIETGALGVALISFLLFSWARLGMASWRCMRTGDPISPAGWYVLTLVLAAELVDYPARTPMVLALVAIGAWLSRPPAEAKSHAEEGDGKFALPV